MITTPKSQSVTEQGEPDGWSPPAGFVRDVGRQGETQVIVSVPTEQLAAAHSALLSVLEGPLSVLYRQVVDRRNPRPQGAPPKDWVAVGLAPERVLAALGASAGVVYHDARCELWVRGRLGDQVVLDADGLIYCQPDDPVFEDVLRAAGLAEGVAQTILDRDYARHWFHAEHDAQEDALCATLGMTEVSPRQPR